MRAFTPASISLLSWGVSGHGYKVALNLRGGKNVNKLDENFWNKKKTQNKTVRTSVYPSQIFFTRFFSWSPWKKMMKTDL